MAAGCVSCEASRSLGTRLAQRALEDLARDRSRNRALDHAVGGRRLVGNPIGARSELDAELVAFETHQPPRSNPAFARNLQHRGPGRSSPFYLAVVVIVKLVRTLRSGFSASRMRTVAFAVWGSFGVFQVKTPVSGSSDAPLGPATSSYFSGLAR